MSSYTTPPGYNDGYTDENRPSGFRAVFNIGGSHVLCQYSQPTQGWVPEPIVTVQQASPAIQTALPSAAHGQYPQFVQTTPASRTEPGPRLPALLQIPQPQCTLSARMLLDIEPEL